MGRNLVALAADSAEGLQELIAETAAGDAPPVLVSGSGPHRAFAALERPADLPKLASLVRTGSADPAGGPPLAFCYSGHGNHWAGMGRDLLSEPVFRAALAEVDRELAPVVGWSVLDELTGDTRLDRTDVIQPAIFAVQVALTRLLASWGATPDLVFGQSIGEVAAAVAAGAYTVGEGARVIGIWSKLVAERAAGTGTVILGELSAEDAERRAGDRADFTGLLGPGIACLAGPNDAIDEIERELAEDGVRTMRVDIDYPSHSGWLEPLVPELLAGLGELSPAATTVPFVSSVTGGLLPGPELGAGYWARNMCGRMLLPESVRAIPGGFRVIEIAPHPTLGLPLSMVLAETGAPEMLATGHRDRPSREALEDLLGVLWTAGADIDWPLSTTEG